jgi:hypothetical protein
VNILGTSWCSVPVGSGECEAAVSNEPSLKTQVTGHSNGCLDGIVRDDANYHQLVVASSAKPIFQISSYERTVGLFRDDRLAGHGRDFWLERMP